MKRHSLALGLLAASLQLPASAQLVLSVNDGKVMQIDGVTRTVEGRDNLALIDLSASPPKIVSQVPVPTSIVGPPGAVDVTRDGRLALISAGFKRHATSPMEPTVAADTVTVVDLQARPPRVLDTLQAGLGAAGVAINREGNLALVANRNEGTVSVFTIEGRTVVPVDKVLLGDAKSGPSQVAFAPDGKTALVTRDGDHRLTLLAIDGAKVTVGRDLFAGIRPYGMEISASGQIAVVANIGMGQGDSDTVSLIDLAARPPRVVDTISVGQTPEGIGLSSDGRYVGVNVMNGTNKAKNSPFYSSGGARFVLLRIEGQKLVNVAQAPIGGWPQGLVFSNDGSQVLVQNAMDRQIRVLEIAGEKLFDRGVRLQLDAAPASIRALR